MYRIVCRYLDALERVDDGPDGVADDEDDNDEEEHHGDGVIATLVRRNGVVTLRRVADRPEDEAVQHDQDQHGDKDESNGVGDEDVVPGVGRVLPDIRWDEGRTKSLLHVVVVQRLVEVGEVGELQLGPQLKESWDVEDERADHDGQGVSEVVVAVAVCL